VVVEQRVAGLAGHLMRLNRLDATRHRLIMQWLNRLKVIFVLEGAVELDVGTREAREAATAIGDLIQVHRAADMKRLRVSMQADAAGIERGEGIRVRRVQ
jgi:hypothetical protein